MLDFPNKIITAILAFVLLILAPILWVYIRDDMISERVALNEMVRFLDKVTDKGEITQQDVDDFYIGVNASGGMYDVDVLRYMVTPLPVGNGEARLLYSAIDFIDADTGEPIALNKGDMVQVTVTEVGLSPAKRMLWTLLRMDSSNFKIELSATVR